VQKPFAAYEGDDSYVFVCYSHDDADVVYPEMVWLRGQGINLWYDEGIDPGSEWSQALADAIEGCSAVLFYVSPRSVQSEPCRREINFALAKRRSISVVYLEETALPGSLELSLTHRQALLRYELSVPVYREKLRASLHKPTGSRNAASMVTQTRSTADASSAPPKRWWAATGIATIALVVVASLLWLLLDPMQERATSAVAQPLFDDLSSQGEQSWPDGYPAASLSRMAFPLPDAPSIAVLPFRTIGDDTDQKHFAEGITDDMITDLSQISKLFVVARNSVFAFEGQNMGPAEVAERLGVRYVLQGSVRRFGSMIRVNAQLIDATTGGSIWANRYDGVLADSLALQDAVTNSVVTALKVELTERERGAVGYQHTINADARRDFQRGWALYRQNTPRTFALAIEHLDAAVQSDPDYLRAYGARAAVYQAALARDFTVRIGEWTRSLGLTPDDVMRHVLSNVRKAASAPSSLTLQVESQLSLWRNNFAQAIAAANAAISLAPNDPLGYEALSAAQTLSGDPQAGQKSIEMAMRLDPAYPDEYLFWHGLALFCAEQYPEARESLELAMELTPGDDRVLIVLAASYGYLRRRTQAQRIIGALDELQSRRQDVRSRSAPGDVQVGIDVHLEGRYTLTEVDLWPFKHVADRERLREGLRLAGLPAMGPKDNQIPLEVEGATTVSVEEARRLYEHGVAVVDVRGLSDRNIGFIPGSTFLNLQTLLSEAALRAKVDPDQEVLFHCEGMR